jgi:hypothetical protein
LLTRNPVLPAGSEEISESGSVSGEIAPQHGLRQGHPTRLEICPWLTRLARERRIVLLTARRWVERLLVFARVLMAVSGKVFRSSHLHMKTVPTLIVLIMVASGSAEASYVDDQGELNLAISQLRSDWYSAFIEPTCPLVPRR